MVVLVNSSMNNWLSGFERIIVARVICSHTMLNSPLVPAN